MDLNSCVIFSKLNDRDFFYFGYNVQSVTKHTKNSTLCGFPISISQANWFEEYEMLLPDKYDLLSMFIVPSIFLQKIICFHEELLLHFPSLLLVTLMTFQANSFAVKINRGCLLFGSVSVTLHLNSPHL